MTDYIELALEEQEETDEGAWQWTEGVESGTSGRPSVKAPGGERRTRIGPAAAEKGMEGRKTQREEVPPGTAGPEGTAVGDVLGGKAQADEQMLLLWSEWAPGRRYGKVTVETRREDEISAAIPDGRGTPGGEEDLFGTIQRVSRAAERAGLGLGRSGSGTQTPAAAGERDGWDPLTLDRLVQRDARRYDGGFSLY